ncbi:hypothetical protein GF337_02050 [candidate division KSB1 bacterium]|nr:hypothetical protein [candidate division KSB1 bacterium]
MKTPAHIQNRLLLLLIWLLTMISPDIILAQYTPEVYKLENPIFSLPQKINLALKQSISDKSIKRIWLAYFIRNEYDSRNINFYPNTKCVNKKYPILRELIHGRISESDLLHKNDRTLSHCNHQFSEKKNVDELVILLDYYLESGHPKILQLLVSTFETHFDLENKPIYWLGKSTENESIDLLIKLFSLNSEVFLRNQIIIGVSSHPAGRKIYDFLDKILSENHEKELKENAIFSLGNLATSYSDRILSKFIRKSDDDNLNKKAILALSQSENPKTFHLLTAIAIKGDNKSVRKEAIFSLSQIEHQKRLDVLRRIAFMDKHCDIQKFAVFVLGQMQNPGAANVLHQLSKKHPSRNIRKKALFWINNQKAPYNHQIIPTE